MVQFGKHFSDDNINFILVLDKTWCNVLNEAVDSVKNKKNINKCYRYV